MYGYIDGVAALVDDLDSFLKAAVGQRHSDQSAKLSHAVVDVHHVVAHLKLLYLFQRQGHLAAACLVALQVVLVEAVENLVVGKQTQS